MTFHEIEWHGCKVSLVSRCLKTTVKHRENQKTTPNSELVLHFFPRWMHLFGLVSGSSMVFPAGIMDDPQKCIFPEVPG